MTTTAAANCGDPAPYAMFGHSGLFGDYFDLITATGGELRRVVLNVASVADANGKTIEDRVRAANRLLEQLGGPHRIEMEHLDAFEPRPNERYVIGFRGQRLQPLRETLRSRFAIAIENLIHPTASVSPSSSRGEGVIVCAGCVIASCVTLGDYCLINRGPTVGQDAAIGEFANIGPGTHLASGVRVGRGAIIGIGAVVIENIVIGAEARVAAAAVVTRDVAPGTMVGGMPARLVNHLKKPQTDDGQWIGTARL